MAIHEKYIVEDQLSQWVLKKWSQMTLLFKKSIGMLGKLGGVRNIRLKHNVCDLITT